MPFTLTCPNCESRRRVADDVAGKKVRCHDCRTVFRAAGPDVDIIEDEDEAPAEPRSRRRKGDDDRPRGKRSQGKAGGKRAKPRHGPAYFVGLAGALLLVAGAVTFVAWKAGAFGPKSDGRVKLDADGEPEYVAPDERIKAPKAEDFSQHVRLTDLRRVWIDEGARGGRYAEIEIEFLNGAKLLSLYFLVEDLPGGGTRKTPLTKMKGAKDQLQYRPQQQGAARVTLWVGKTKYLPGGKEELVRVSNTIEVNLEGPG